MPDGVARGERAAASRTEVRLLDPAELRLRANDRNQLELHISDGVVHTDVRVAPAFPISRPNRFVHFRTTDGKEIGVLADPRRLDRESRDLVLRQLDHAYFMPHITRIIRIDERMGIAHWETETDRGSSSFDVIARSESVWFVGKNRLVVRDADGNRYLIEDLTALDQRSRRLADLYM
jgi:hypothetical protein